MKSGRGVGVRSITGGGGGGGGGEGSLGAASGEFDFIVEEDTSGSSTTMKCEVGASTADADDPRTSVERTTKGFSGSSMSIGGGTRLGSMGMFNGLERASGGENVCSG